MNDYTILGAEGFIGRHLAQFLHSKGLRVGTPHRDSREIWNQDLGRVIYCVGVTGDFIDRPLDTVDAHVCNLAALLRRARFSTLVYLSSTRVYDGQPGPASEEGTLTLNPLDPRHIYDFSKGLGEALCHAFPQRHMVVARLASVYDDALQSAGFLDEVCRAALSAKEFSADASPETERDYVHVDDVCKALLLLAGEPRHSVYNVASGDNLTNRELADIVGRATGCKITLRGIGPPRPVPRIDISRLVAEFGFRPVSPRDRLAQILLNAGKRAGGAAA